MGSQWASCCAVVASAVHCMLTPCFRYKRQDVDQKHKSFWVNPSLPPQRLDQLLRLQLSSLICSALLWWIFPRASGDAWSNDRSEILTVGLIWHLSSSEESLTREKVSRLVIPAKYRGAVLPSVLVDVVVLPLTICSNCCSDVTLQFTKTGGVFLCVFKSKWKLLFPLCSWVPNGWLRLRWLL